MLFNYKGHRIFAFSDTHGMHRRLYIPESADILLCAGDVVSGIGKDGFGDFFFWLLSHPASLYIYLKRLFSFMTSHTSLMELSLAISL